MCDFLYRFTSGVKAMNDKTPNCSRCEKIEKILKDTYETIEENIGICPLDAFDICMFEVGMELDNCKTDIKKCWKNYFELIIK